MDSRILVERLKADGKALLAYLDKHNIYFPVAMWIYDNYRDAWQLLLAKADVRNVGMKPYLMKIDQVLEKMDPPLSLDVADIHIMSTDDELPRLFRRTMKTGKRISEFAVGGNVMEGRLLPDAWAYRIAATPRKELAATPGRVKM